MHTQADIRLERRREDWFEELMAQPRSRATAAAASKDGDGSGEETETTAAAPRVPFLRRNVKDVTVDLEDLEEHNGLEMQFGDDKISFVKFTEDAMYRVSGVALEHVCLSVMWCLFVP